MKMLIPSRVLASGYPKLPYTVSSRRHLSLTASNRRLENVLIIGAGFMGSGIAQACAIPGTLQSITLQDKSQDQLEKARGHIHANLIKLKEKNKLNITNDPEEIASRIHFSLEAVPPAGCHQNLLILETISEVLEWKQKLFQELTLQYRDNDSVIFATNTSSLLGANICAPLPEKVKVRFGGLHFLDALMSPLVEISRTEWTAESTVSLLKSFASDIRKGSIVCQDMEGLIANRLQIQLMRAALQMVDRGQATPEDIDAALKLGFGNPMGPFETMDFIGLDVIQLIMDQWEGTDPGGVLRSATIDQRVAAGQLGRKTGRGFYDYTNSKQKKSIK